MLNKIQNYSDSDLLKARQLCPAIDRYIQLNRELDRQVSQQPLEHSSFHRTLRRKRHRYWLQAALATHLESASAQDVCMSWSQAADDLILQAWRLSGAEDLDLCVFALGKLGSRELNLSSDVDLFYISKNPADQATLASLRKFHSLLNDTTEDGYCLRVDNDIRPGGRLGPLVSSISQVEDYYWTQGATWERLALVRARHIAGDKNVAEQAQNIFNKFTYRRFLDYTLLEELKGLRKMIHQYNANNSSARNLKLDPGGIRDIELFIHALQVVHGGKNPSLQTQSTAAAVTKLKSLDVFPKRDLDFLISSYWQLREWENHLQIVNDRQTYQWFKKPDSEIFSEKNDHTISEINKKVDSIVSGLLGKVEAQPSELPQTIEGQQQKLRTLGFSKHTIDITWPKLIKQTALSKFTQRDEFARLRFLQLFIEEAHQHGLDKDLAINLLLDFTRAIRAKATFFTLLIREPNLTRDLALLFSTSPYLGGILCSRPELIDSFIYRSQDDSHQDLNSLLESSTERRLLGEIIAANQFLAQRNLTELTELLSSLADEICLGILEGLKKEYGDCSLQIIALGKWGGRELGLRSDLDFVFVSPKDPTELDHRIARRFISRLTEQHKGGAIYAIDIRLRPSGNAGPLLTTEKKLEEYLKNKAAAWERQAYLRARPLYNCDAKLSLFAAQKGLSLDEVKDLKEIKQKLVKPCADNGINIKYNPGGLVDIEFAVQTSLLAHKATGSNESTVAMIECLRQRDPIWSKYGQELTQIYSKLRTLEQTFQLTTNISSTTLKENSDSFERLAKFLKLSPKELSKQIEATIRQSQELLKNLDPISASS